MEDIHTYSAAPDLRITYLALECADTLDYFVFSSASGVKGYFGTVGVLGEKLIPVCIGENTSAELAKYTNRYYLSNDVSTESIVEKIMELSASSK